jgi:asparagine synthase (glutamine-hydrolysing)
MCGFAGVYHWKPEGRPTDAVLRGMSESLRVRGPDEAGSYVGDGISLVHRRLSIIDPKSGQQPMLSEDKRFVLVFNGAIYNYVELRKELIALGYEFHTDSDTEVLLNAYRAWGLECQQRLNGMWAFAIYDAAIFRDDQQWNRFRLRAEEHPCCWSYGPAGSGNARLVPDLRIRSGALQFFQGP